MRSAVLFLVVLGVVIIALVVLVVFLRLTQLSKEHRDMPTARLEAILETLRARVRAEPFLRPSAVRSMRRKIETIEHELAHREGKPNVSR